jgi:signal transduction histidine kinase
MNRLLVSTPFRVAVILGVAFLIAFVIADVVAFNLIEQELDRRADQSITDTFNVISGAYGDSDQLDLIDSVRAHAASTLDHDKVYGLADASGAVLAGNVAAFPSADGWTTSAAQTLGLLQNQGDQYRLFIGKVGDSRLLVGSSFGETRDVAMLTAVTLAFASLVILVIVLAIGIFMATRAQQRIDGIAHTMARVGQGELTARIPLGGRQDDINLLAGQVNRALDRLSALVEGMRQVSVDIAHDLKTPLNRLAITLDTAKAAAERGASVASHLMQAEIEVQEIGSTFDALLRIAQVEAGARRSRFVRLQLAEILERIGDVYTDVADERAQSLKISVIAPLPLIEGDRELLTQLCANLVENSMTHCPAGTRIEITVASIGGRVVATFADNGPGIPVEEHRRVFERLYRVDKSRTTSGSGLGLSLVKAVADLHGASLEVRDRDPGLVISVSFPAAAER